MAQPRHPLSLPITRVGWIALTERRLIRSSFIIPANLVAGFVLVNFRALILSITEYGIPGFPIEGKDAPNQPMSTPVDENPE